MEGADEIQCRYLQHIPHRLRSLIWNNHANIPCFSGETYDLQAALRFISAKAPVFRNNHMLVLRPSTT